MYWLNHSWELPEDSHLESIEYSGDYQNRVAENEDKLNIIEQQKSILNQVYWIYTKTTNTSNQYWLSFSDKFPNYNNISDLLNDDKLANSWKWWLVYELVIIEMFIKYLRDESYLSLSNKQMDTQQAINMYWNIGGINTVIQFSINSTQKTRKKEDFLKKWQQNELNENRVTKKNKAFKKLNIKQTWNNSHSIDTSNNKAIYLHVNEEFILGTQEMVSYFYRWHNGWLNSHWLNYWKSEKSINWKSIDQRFKIFIELIEKFMSHIH